MHPLYKNGINDYRDRCFSFYKKECAVCGFNIEQILFVHHIDKNRDNNIIENLIPLCANHHIMIHSNLMLDEIELKIKEFKIHGAIV